MRVVVALQLVTTLWALCHANQSHIDHVSQLDLETIMDAAEIAASLNNSNISEAEREKKITKLQYIQQLYHKFPDNKIPKELALIVEGGALVERASLLPTLGQLVFNNNRSLNLGTSGEMSAQMVYSFMGGFGGGGLMPSQVGRPLEKPNFFTTTQGIVVLILVSAVILASGLAYYLKVRKERQWAEEIELQHQDNFIRSKKKKKIKNKRKRKK